MGESVAAGRVIGGKYRVERVIGRGGMGVVVAARHLALEQQVAIKLVSVAASEVAIKRCLREARAAAGIKSDHVVKIFDVGSLDNGAPFIVMELLEGHDLDTLLHARGPLPLELAIDYVVQACEALAEAHTLGIVHRDIKPSNLFVTMRPGREDMIKLLDFGVSKEGLASPKPSTALTQTNAVLGSPQFMSPEQLTSARDVDARADIWSLGATLHELLCARPAFEAEMLASLCQAILREPPADLLDYRPDLPDEVASILLKCLEKDRELRYRSLAELVADLAPLAPERSRPGIARIIAGIEAAQPEAAAPQAPAPATAAPASDQKTTAPYDGGTAAIAPPASDQKTTAPANEHATTLPFQLAADAPPPAAPERSADEQEQEQSGAGAWPVAHRSAKRPPPGRRVDDEVTGVYVRPEGEDAD